MFSAFANIFRIADLRNRVLFTLAVLAIRKMLAKALNIQLLTRRTWSWSR